MKEAHIQVDTRYGSYCLFVNFTYYLLIVLSNMKVVDFTSQNLWRLHFRQGILDPGACDF